MPITLRQLRYFCALAETENFGLAAEKCHISQPALSVQIKELETVLGTSLVDRRPRQVRLTPMGRAVLDRARRILADVRQLETLPRRAGALAGALHLGVIPTVAPYLLPGALARLRARDLTLDIRVREAQTERLLDQLENGDLDAAIVALPVGRPGLTTLPLFQDRFLLAGSAARLSGLAVNDLAPQNIDPEALLLLDEGHCLADQAIAACGLDPGARRIDLGASSLATLCGLVAQGFGLTLLPEIAVPTETASAPDLALRRLRAPEPGRTLALALSAGQVAPWAPDLADLLTAAGKDLLDRAHARLQALEQT